MPSFKTNGRITLQPYDSIGYEFQITACSAADVRDGYIPYNTTVSLVDVVVTDDEDNDVTSDLVVGTPSVATNIISVVLKYPVTNGEGRYKLTFRMTLSDGSKKEADFGRVVAEDK